MVGPGRARLAAALAEQDHGDGTPPGVHVREREADRREQDAVEVALAEPAGDIALDGRAPPVSWMNTR
ncbi:hypothetical protein GCM10025875_18700 [Litorihabitans aurantiacus]|uniref:Uncharacterized protein n=1 Tax=Litorihabitans aurantiacus TaxID=1930061 RepID=A0AA37XEL8_9MICO|nr:hypothetical protein GCM10025875_18700 [Litorihabitans aurantiacus]